MKKTNFVIEKVPLKAFIDILIEAFNSGANFIDILSVEDNTVGLLCKESYYSAEEEGSLESITFNEDDVDQLI